MRATCILPWLLLGAATAVPAQAPPALQSPRCSRALEALQANEAALPASGAASSAAARDALARHEGLRREAARECLGGTGRAQPSHSTRAPLVVPPTALPSPPAAPVLPPVRPPVQQPPNAGAPLVITGCDAAGCWTSDGGYLQRSGGTLFGPRGLCSVLGRTVTCP